MSENRGLSTSADQWQCTLNTCTLKPVTLMHISETEYVGCYISYSAETTGGLKQLLKARPLTSLESHTKLTQVWWKILKNNSHTQTHKYSILQSYTYKHTYS